MMMKTKALFLFILLNCSLLAEDNYSMDTFDVEIVSRDLSYYIPPRPQGVSKCYEKFTTYDQIEKCVFDVKINYPFNAQELQSIRFGAINQYLKESTEKFIKEMKQVNPQFDFEVYSRKILGKERDFSLQTKRLQSIQQECLQKLSRVIPRDKRGEEIPTKKIKGCIRAKIIKIWESE